MRQELTYGPFHVSVREDADGDWLCTATIQDTVLFEDIAYHQLSMAMFLLDEIVRQELRLEGDVRDITRD